MAATGFSIDVGEFLSNSAIQYFRHYKRLPPNNLTVESVTTVSGNSTLESLLKAVNASQQKNFLIYAHGQSDGSGLYIRVADRRSAAIGMSATATAVNTLLALEKSDKDADRQRQFLGIGEAEAKRLVGLIRSIRAKKIETVEFRGCNLGKNLGSIDSFKNLFGAKVFGAPDLYSFFGHPQVSVGANVIANHRSQRGRLEPRNHSEWLEFPHSFEKPAGNLINAVSVGEVSGVSLKPLAGYIVADTVATVDRWAKTFIDSEAKFAAGDTNLAIHGMWDRGQGKVDIKQMQDAPIGKEPELPPVRLIMPIGSEDYKKHVIYK